MRMPFLLPPVIVIVVLLGCSRSERRWQPNTQWRAEIVSETNSTWRGSYQNALDTLRLRSHAWKLIDYDPKRDRCEWGFKVTVEFPSHPDYKPGHNDPSHPDKITFWPVMTISKIDYELFDKDGFHLASLSLLGTDLVVETQETFHHTGFISSALARRAVSGRVNI
jgi:hypothetical protein